MAAMMVLMMEQGLVLVLVSLLHKLVLTLASKLDALLDARLVVMMAL
jgi:hypothetical protein